MTGSRTDDDGAKSARATARPRAAAVEWVESLVDGHFDAVVVLDGRGHALHANAAAARLFGRSARDLVGAELPAHSAEVHRCEVEWDGEGATIVFLRDKAELAGLKRDLAASEERYELAARAASDGLWDWDIERGTARFSERWREILGCRDEGGERGIELWLERIHPEDRDRVQSALRAHVDGLTSHLETEHRVRHETGAWRWVLCRGLAVRGSDGTARRIAGSLSDVTHRKVAEEQLAHRAFYDPLTNLPNRALFLDRLRHALRRTTRRKDYSFAVLFLDIDRFKVINDSLGHMAGDRLLVMIARRLELSLRPGDSVARLGGDEFTVLLDGVRDVSEATAVADRIHAELVAPFDIGGQEIVASASIGIAFSGTGYQRPEDMLRDADTAMYRAKARGRARHALFDTQMHAHAVRLLQIEADLRRAVERSEMRVFYQPVVALDSGRIVGVEALARWEHGERGLVPPSEFIPVAEETGLIVNLGRWVLREACREFASWRAQIGAEAVQLSVNLSSKQLSQPDLAREIAQALADAGLDASTLQLEITESAILDHPESAAATLHKLKELGVRLSMDDFGTGYSSLSYLQRFPIDALKIDRSFVQNLTLEGETAGEDSRIARTIVMIGQNLGKAVIAEGVETADQLALLRAVRCDCGQGYFFSRPLRGEDARRLIAEDRRW